MNTTETKSNRVTTIISQKVKHGREEEYENWIRGISHAAQQFEGHNGVTILRPQDCDRPEYFIILQFTSEYYLQQWLNSQIRKDWIDRSHSFIEQAQNIQVLTGLETWFTLPHKPMQRPPARYKMAILTTVCVFTLVNLYNWLLSGLLANLPPLLRSLIVVVLVVLSLTYVVMPRLTKLFHGWLFPK
jgi:uncharacterized protein